jgi:hypothetical protein
MSPDSGPGIPGWFIALFVIVALLGVGVTIWRVSVARQIAKNAGIDPNTATAVTLLSDDGVGAAYVASTLASRPSRPSSPSEPRKTAEQRLGELQNLRERGLVSDEEYQAQRAKILGSI